jgi:hypothetical protein
MRALSETEISLLWEMHQKLRRNCFQPQPIQFTKEEVWYLTQTLSDLALAKQSPFLRPSDGSFVE